MGESAPVSRIYVVAGANGAGKSSIGGAMLVAAGAAYFNPDAAAARILAANPTISQQDANSAVWHEGKRLLERAIGERLDFAFETTLGGKTIPSLLAEACRAGIEVRVWYVGLASPDLHIARVRARVAAGGHDIPEDRIRERYVSSVLNLIRLMPMLAELRVYDNSTEGDPRAGVAPRPLPILHLLRRTIVALCDLAATPAWAKPIVLSALKLSR